MDRDGNILFQTGSGIWIYTATNLTLPIAEVGESVTYQGEPYKISDLGLIESISGGEDGRPRYINDWGRMAFVARIYRGTRNISVLMAATLPSGGIPEIKPVANSDSIQFRSAFGSTLKLNVLANDVTPVLDPVSIEIIADAAFGKISVRNGFIYYTPGSLFVAEDAFQYALSNRWGLSQTATVVVRNPYFASSGSYGSEVHAGSSQVGTANLTLSIGGRLTGRIQYGDHVLKLNGAFEGDGFQQAFTQPGGETVTVTLQQHLEAGNPVRISGSIESSLSGSFEIKPTTRFGLPGNLKTTKVTGQFRTDGDVSLPKGIGFLVGTLSSNGSFITRGRLADNQPFSASSRMKSDVTVAFDCFPYGKGRGRISGLFSETDSGSGARHWDATLQWTRNPVSGGAYPEGINGPVTALFATYAPTPGMPAISNTSSIATGAFTANFDGDLPFRETLSWSQRDVVIFTPPNLNLVRLRVNRGSGLVSGSYLSLGQELRKFAGVVFSLENGAIGLVNGGPATGSFILYAN